MKYIVLLRGINISGRNKIAMPKLKTVLEENGFNDVVTYLNSGNVIVDSDVKSKKILSQKILEIIREKFQLEIPIFVTTEIELEDVLNHSPDWWDTDDKSIYNNLIFVIPPAGYSEIYAAVGEPSRNIDYIEEYNNHIFWSFDLKNYRKSNWWKKTASTNIKDKITIRTANTMRKMLILCKK